MKRLKEKAASLMASLSGRNRLVDNLLAGGSTRLLTVSALAGAAHFAYALLNLVLAYAYKSYWFVTMGAYYLTVCGMRASALKAKDDKRALKRAALLTFLLAFIFSGIIFLSVAEQHNTVRNHIVAIAMAAYTFWCLGIATANLLRSRKRPTVQSLLLRCTSLVCALGSMFALERTLLGTFSEGSSRFPIQMEAASGAALFIFLIYLGFRLYRKAR